MTRKTRTFAVVAAVGGLATVPLSNNLASALSAATTSSSSSSANTTVAPGSSSPSTSAPATSGPASSAPSSSGATTSGPSTSGPSTTGSGPTSSAPSTSGPSTSGPATSGPSTSGAATTVPAPPTTGASVAASVKTLSTSSAQAAATAAYDACKAKNLNVTVAVVGRDGALIALLRNEAAVPASVDSATGKAYASASFKQASGDLGEAAKTNPGIVQMPKFVVLRGGLPISVDKEVIGAIGVGGAPSGEQDETCAKAGIEAITKK